MLELQDEDWEDWKTSQLFTETCTNQITNWLMRSWNTFSARTNHGQTQTHKTHHGLDLGEAITFPLIVFSMPSHAVNTQMSFCARTPKLWILKFPKLGLLWLWRPTTLCVNLQLKWGLKQSYSPFWEIFNNMSHTTCTPPTHKEVRAIPDFWWSRINLTIWLPTFLLAITYVLITEMNHTNHFRHLSSNIFLMI
jgi:hypothetical protein